MATVPVIDVNRPIVEIMAELNADMARNGAPSPYFEELWYALTVCLADFDARITALEGP